MRSQTNFIAIVIVLSWPFVAGLMSLVQSGLGCCAHCGHEGDCQKICRLVTENRKVTITCWGVQSEDFCDPCPSERGCEHCEMVCDESHAPIAPCVRPKRFVWTEWLPTGTRRIYTKKKLMKKTVTKTIPSYKWVVEDLCTQCEPSCQSVTVPPDTKIPPVPAVDAKVK